MSSDLKRSDEVNVNNDPPAEAEPPKSQSFADTDTLPPSTDSNSNTNSNIDSESNQGSNAYNASNISNASSNNSPSNAFSEQRPKAQSHRTKNQPNPLKRLFRRSRSASDPLDEFTLRYQVPEIIKPGKLGQLKHPAFAKPVAVDDYPPGYGRVAAFEDCDPSFQICRKFGWLHIRLLLHLQDEVQELEEELESLDEWEFSSGDPLRLKNRRIDYGRPNAPRKALLTKIAVKLAEYDEVLLRLQKKQEVRKATKRNQNSLYNAIKSSQSMMSGEALWIHNRDDLLALAKDAEHGWFNGILEDTLRRLSSKITLAIFRTPEQKKKTGSMSSMSLISPYRLDVLLRIVLTIIALVLLLVPVIILYEIQATSVSGIKSSSRAQIATVFSFTVAFSASCSIFTKAKRQEVFTATAAYCAVLVVFLGNTSNVMVVSR